MLKRLLISALLLSLLLPARGQDFTATVIPDFQKIETNGLASSAVFCGESEGNIFMFAPSVGGMALSTLEKTNLLVTKSIKIDFNEVSVGKKTYPLTCVKALVSGDKLIAAGKLFDKKTLSFAGLYMAQYNLDGTISKGWTKLDDESYPFSNPDVGTLVANPNDGLIVFHHTEANKIYCFDGDLKLLSTEDEDGNVQRFYGLSIFKTFISKSGKTWMLGKDEDGCVQALQLSLSADGELEVEESNTACFKAYNDPESEAFRLSRTDCILSDYKIVDDRYLLNYGIITDTSAYTGTFFSKFDMKENKMLVETKTDFTAEELEEFKIKLPVYDNNSTWSNTELTYKYLTSNPAIYAVKQQQGNEENAYVMTFQKMYAKQIQTDKGTVAKIYRQDMFTFRYDSEGKLLWKAWLPAQQEYSVYAFSTVEGLAFENTNTQNASFYTVDVINGAFASWGTSLQTDEAKKAAKSKYGVGIIKIDNNGKVERIPVFGLGDSHTDQVKSYTYRSGNDLYFFQQDFNPWKLKIKIMKVSVR